MCFSASASFTASAVLSVAGLVTLSQIKNKREIPLAIIPLVFALQQFIEGWLWINLQSANIFTELFTYLFLFFALLWWPIFIPIAAYCLEEIPWRKKIALAGLTLGILVGLYQFGLFLASPAPAQIREHCIYYPLSDRYQFAVIIFYGLATLATPLFSSKKSLNALAVLAFLSASVAWYEYQVNFASVWCFFAAVISSVILFYFVKRPKVA